MPSDRRERSASAGSHRSGHSRASSSMGYDGGEAGRRMAVEDEYIRKELQDSSSFCNSFWGINDAGYPVIQARMKSAARALDDMRAMYKERAEIEADYSKRLAKLGKQPFGKDETGSMRAAMEVVRMEIDQTSKTHADLSALIKKDLEGQLAEYQAKIQNQRKNSLAQIEKLFKQKQTQESYVNKSRDKYEQDCIKINGYTAQSSLVQGRDLDKVTNKLDKAQSTVSSNDKDYQNFVRALKDTTHRWNSEWKSYLDQCQDLEEDRLEFLKGNMWNYANAISAVCVADDESCERVRVSLETCEAPKDIVDFIQRAGTGSAIADPPEYINYSKGQPPPPRPTFKTANFQRTTTRQMNYLPSGPSIPNTASVPQPPANDIPVPPASNGRVDPSGGSSQNRPENEAAAPSFRPPPAAVGMPGMVLSGTQGTIVASPTKEEPTDPPMNAPKAERRMSARNFIARTPSMSRSSRSQQGGGGAQHQQQMAPSETTSTVSTQQTSIDHDDPIAKALANLRMRPGGKSPGPQSPASGPPPPGKQSNPFANEPRARSPSAAFMQQPERATSPLPVEEVIDQYGQHFPGERRISRQNSTASRTSRMSVQQAPPSDRAKSPGPGQASQGFAGIGARGRSPSPQPFHRPQGTSTPQPSQRHSSHYAQASPAVASPPKQSYASSQNRPAQTNQVPPIRSTTPLGIALDASGSVTHDQMADEYIRRTGSVGPGQMGSSASQPAVQRLQPQYNPSIRTASPVHSAVATPGHSFAPPLQQQNSYNSMANQYIAQPPPPQQVHQQQPAAPPGGPQYGYQQPPAGYAPSASPVAAIRQPPAHQDSMSSIGRQGGSYQQYQQSPYNQTPASVQAPPPQQSSTPAPAPATAGHPYAQNQPHTQQMSNGAAFGRVASPYQAPVQQQETPAASYMHQYQQQQHQHPGPPAQAQVQQASYQQAQSNRWSTQAPPPPTNDHMSYSHGEHSAYAQPPAQYQTQQPAPVMQQQQQGPPPRSNTQTAPPTGQFSDTGKPILFYVKALYDYQATTEEEFSFTAGDIIAVWETNPDGWWQGELLDDARRRAGANTFPSNFVSLLT